MCSDGCKHARVICAGVSHDANDVCDVSVACFAEPVMTLTRALSAGVLHNRYSGSTNPLIGLLLSLPAPDQDEHAAER